ncbi:hypothetical protein [Undibacter mobilis]|nr:hypothetical protein [Undibacter mobilis]
MAGRLFYEDWRCDKAASRAYIARMGKWYVIAPLLAVGAASLWFAARSWWEFASEIPLYGYFAIIGGVFFSLLIGGGLMALAFYSDKHGYDDMRGGEKD